MTTHAFAISNAFANDHAFYAERLYRKVFQASEVRLVTDINGQRSGVDVLVGQLNHPIRIEEKIRKNQYGDVFLEIWSAEEQGVPGWMEKNLSCDYLSYIVLEDRTVILFPYPLLRQAWHRNKETWKSMYPIKRIPNMGRYSSYTTVGVCVPQDVIWKEIRKPFWKRETT